jgi:transcriptional regulator with XRE-family HTH domain
MLALKDTIKAISKDRKITQLEIAEHLGISKQNFSNKMQRNTFSPDELSRIASLFNMELAFIDKTAKITDGEKFVIEENQPPEE